MIVIDRDGGISEGKDFMFDYDVVKWILLDGEELTEEELKHLEYHDIIVEKVEVDLWQSSFL